MHYNWNHKINDIIMKNGLLIFSAPSGSGKSTIVNWLMKEHPELKLAFSISCTSRAPRGTEKNGVEYFFLTPEEFKAKIANEEFLEYEEVYQDRFYGTLKSQVENQLNAGDSVIFDVDVKGGVNIKKFYGERALSIFVQPPSVEELRRRLNFGHGAQIIKKRHSLLNGVEGQNGLVHIEIAGLSVKFIHCGFIPPFSTSLHYIVHHHSRIVKRESTNFFEPEALKISFRICLLNTL